MQKPAVNQPRVEVERLLDAPEADDARELALLAQFMRHDSVASLAGAIAQRLGGATRGGDLIAAAGLCERRGER